MLIKDTDGLHKDSLNFVAVMMLKWSNITPNAKEYLFLANYYDETPYVIKSVGDSDNVLVSLEIFKLLEQTGVCRSITDEEAKEANVNYNKSKAELVKTNREFDSKKKEIADEKKAVEKAADKAALAATKE